MMYPDSWPQYADRRMIGKVRAALERLEAARLLIGDAELNQSESEPLEGPGSGEWEEVRRRIEHAARGLRKCMDSPGLLEDRQNEINTWDDGGLWEGADNLEIVPQYSGIWVTFDFGEHYGKVQMAASVRDDMLGEGFIDISIAQRGGDGLLNHRRVHAQRAQQPWPLSELLWHATLEEARQAWSTSDLVEHYADAKADGYLDADPPVENFIDAAVEGGAEADVVRQVRELAAKLG